MGSYFDAFKTYKVERQEECSWLYDIVFEDDIETSGLYSTVLCKTHDFLKQYDIHLIGNIVPYIREETYENLEKSEIENRISAFVEPTVCLEYIREKNIREIINKVKPDSYKEMLALIDKLIEYWEQGYYIHHWY